MRIVTHTVAVLAAVVAIAAVVGSAKPRPPTNPRLIEGPDVLHRHADDNLINTRVIVRRGCKRYAATLVGTPAEQLTQLVSLCATARE